MVTYQKKTGTMKLKDQKGETYTLSIRQEGNCLAVFTYEYYDKEKDIDRLQLINFFLDEQHMKNLQKQYNHLFTDEILSINLNIASKPAEKLAKAFAKLGYPVTINYQK